MRLTQRAENIVLPIAAVVIALLIGAVLIWLNGSNPWTAYTALHRGRARQPRGHRPHAGPGHTGHAHRPRRHRRHEGRPVQHRRPGPVAVRGGVRGVGRLPLHRPAERAARAPRPARRRGHGHAAGRLRRLPQGLPRGPRGDHDDHAQRHPRQHDRVPRRGPRPVPRPGGGRDLAARRGSSPRRRSATSSGSRGSRSATSSP